MELAKTLIADELCLASEARGVGMRQQQQIGQCRLGSQWQTLNHYNAATIGTKPW
jgi:hypothetical protein